MKFQHKFRAKISLTNETLLLLPYSVLLLQFWLYCSLETWLEQVLVRLIWNVNENEDTDRAKSWWIIIGSLSYPDLTKSIQSPRVDYKKLGTRRKAQRPNFEKLFCSVKFGCRHRAQMDRAISMKNSKLWTFMKLTPNIP